MIVRNFVVDFTLPDDGSLFIHHGTNIAAPNPKEARAKFAAEFPDAKIRDVYQGIVMLYGRKYATWDSTRGAECAPAQQERTL